MNIRRELLENEWAKAASEIIWKRETTMLTTLQPPTVKVIGAKGQISLGKKYAGCQVLVEEQEPGVWLVRTVTVIPDNERWLHQPQAAADLERALAWAAAHPSDDANVEQLLKELDDGKG